MHVLYFTLCLNGTRQMISISAGYPLKQYPLIARFVLIQEVVGSILSLVAQIFFVAAAMRFYAKLY